SRRKAEPHEDRAEVGAPRPVRTETEAARERDLRTVGTGGLGDEDERGDREQTDGTDEAGPRPLAPPAERGDAGGEEDERGDEHGSANHAARHDRELRVRRAEERELEGGAPRADVREEEEEAEDREGDLAQHWRGSLASRSPSRSPRASPQPRRRSRARARS